MPFVHTASGTGTDQELLDNARAMHARIMANGQEYYVGNRRVVLPDIDKVSAEIKRLEAKIAAESGGQSSVGSAETKVYFKRPL